MRRSARRGPYVWPQRLNPETIYLDYSGDDGGAGTLSSPVATASRAQKIANERARVRPGPFYISLVPDPAHSTYADPTNFDGSGSMTYDSEVMSRSRVTWVGVADNSKKPVTWIRGSTDGTRDNNFVSATQNCAVLLQDVMLHSFASAGRASQSGRLTYSNVHVKNVVRAQSLGNQGFGSAQFGYWSGKDLLGNPIADNVGGLAVIGANWNYEQANFGDLVIDGFDRNIVGDVGGDQGHLDFLDSRNARIHLNVNRMGGAPNITGMQFANDVLTAGTIGYLAMGTNSLILSPDQIFTNLADNLVCTDSPTLQSIIDFNYELRSPIKRGFAPIFSGSNGIITGDVLKHTAWNFFNIVKARMRARDLVADLQIDFLCPGALAAAATLTYESGANVLATLTIPINTVQGTLKGKVIALDKQQVGLKLELHTGTSSTVMAGPPQIVSVFNAGTVVSLTAHTPQLIAVTLGNAADKFQMQSTSHVNTTISSLTI